MQPAASSPPALAAPQPADSVFPTPSMSPPDQAPSRRRKLAITILAAVVVLAGVGVGTFLALRADEDVPVTRAADSSAGPTGGGGAGPSETAPATPSSTTTGDATGAPTSSPSGSAPAATAGTPDDALALPEAAAGSQLEAMTTRDAQVVGGLAGSWVPQVSSKCSGLRVDLGPGWQPDGVADTDAVTTPQILALHLSQSSRFGAVTTTAAALGSRSVPKQCRGKPLWVSLVPQAYSSSDRALAWCSASAYPAGECGARLVVAPGEPGTRLEL